mgnify:CR=1 FL=1
MMDAFTGTHMERILQAEPELKRDLDGFVWYPDTLAAGPSTNTGIASVLCGYDCTPLAINAQGSESVAEKVNRSYGKFINRLGDKWDVSLYERNWLEEMRLRKYTDQDVLGLRYLSDAYTDRYIERQRHRHRPRQHRRVFACRVGLFRRALERQKPDLSRRPLV